MALGPKLENLVCLTTTHFQLLNRNKYLSRSDKKRLKFFFLESILSPSGSKALSPKGHGANNHAQVNGTDFMTARDVETWLKIDVKTLYRYAELKLIPHLRIRGNVRFRREDLQRWVSQHSHVARTVKSARQK